MWMTRGDDTQHLKVGDTFTMEPETPHAEKYGAEGTIYWAARSFPKI
jgi:quercetin dioxygenase-like cupin family protein